MKKRLITVSILVLVCAALLAACGSTSSEVVEAHAPAATPVPTPSPSPYVEQTFYAGSAAVVVNGTTVSSVMAGDNGDIVYLPLADAVKAMDSALDSYTYNSSYIRQDFTFSIDGVQYVFYPDTTTCTVDGEERSFTDKTIAYNSQRSLYVSMNSFAEVMDMQVINDESNETYYCVPTRNFTVTPGVEVPVLCYYGIGDKTTANYTYEVFLNEDIFASMLDRLLDSGYEPIFFEDLDHLEDYTKPVILMFCTSASNIYSTAYPLLKSYQVKANVFVFPDEIGDGASLTMSQLKEMYKSGYVSLQGGGVVRDLTGTEVSERRQQLDVQEAYLDVVRVTGQLPVAYCFGNGVDYDETAWNLAKDYFALGVTSHGANTIYTTGTDDNAIPTFVISRYYNSDNALAAIGATGDSDSDSTASGYSVNYNEDGSYTIVANG